MRARVLRPVFQVGIIKESLNSDDHSQFHQYQQNEY
jgi:hypothetical protein